MKKTMSPLLIAGLVIFALYIITNRFILPIPNGIAIPLLIADIVLIAIGGLKSKQKTNK